jgi:hypothetical protein
MTFLHHHEGTPQPHDAAPRLARRAHALALGSEVGDFQRHGGRGEPDQFADPVKQVQTISRRVARDFHRVCLDQQRLCGNRSGRNRRQRSERGQETGGGKKA